MNIKSLIQHGLINAVFFTIILFFFYNNPDQSELISRIDTLNNKIDEINSSLSQSSSLSSNFSIPVIDSQEHSQVIVMPYKDVQLAINNAFESNHDSHARNTQQPENSEKSLSLDQQYQYEILNQKLDNFEKVTFHEVLNDMDNNQLPLKYRNEILSKLATKLNNNEITPEQVLGATQ